MDSKGPFLKFLGLPMDPPKSPVLTLSIFSNKCLRKCPFSPMFGNLPTLTSPSQFFKDLPLVPTFPTIPSLLIWSEEVVITVWSLFGMSKKTAHNPLWFHQSKNPILTLLLTFHGFQWKPVLNSLPHLLTEESYGGTPDNSQKDQLIVFNWPNKLKEKTELLEDQLLNSTLKLVPINS